MVYHSFAVMPDGTLRTWGQNTYGKLGNGSTTDSSTPVQVPGLSGVVGVAGGRGHSLALKADGTVWAWGLNDHGQLGATTSSTCAGSPCSLVPVQVTGVSGARAVAVGGYVSYALKTDGTVRAWVEGDNGELGNGTSPDSQTPVQAELPMKSACRGYLKPRLRSTARMSRRERSSA